ncbi:MAG: ABC transporter ATP-binding protein [Chloroflexi bacterium]|nr:ABC transporter ATP-binding protein [Chloroflexota bacterium]
MAILSPQTETKERRDGPILVETRGLTKIYGTTVEVRALDHVDLTVAEGEMVAVMGPSGSGKSTLLNMLGALDRPSSGEVWIAGQNLAQVRDLDRFRARTVGFVFQMHNLIPTLTALENVEVPLRGQGLSGRRRRERAREVLALVGLSDREDHLPSQLSGGQRQRVAIARALVNNPHIILADEPTGNLDSASGEQVMALLAELNRSQGTTILVVTHDRHVARSTERIISMLDGRIVGEHRVADPLMEDLRSLAQSELGRALIARDVDILVKTLADSPLVSDGRLSEWAEEMARYLARLV